MEQALIKGVGDYLEEDLAEALKTYPRAVDIIDGPLMSGMNKVGDLFGAGLRDFFSDLGRVFEIAGFDLRFGHGVEPGTVPDGFDVECDVHLLIPFH